MGFPVPQFPRKPSSLGCCITSPVGVVPLPALLLSDETKQRLQPLSFQPASSSRGPRGWGLFSLLRSSSEFVELIQPEIVSSLSFQSPALTLYPDQCREPRSLPIDNTQHVIYTAHLTQVFLRCEINQDQKEESVSSRLCWKSGL